MRKEKQESESVVNEKVKVVVNSLLIPWNPLLCQICTSLYHCYPLYQFHSSKKKSHSQNPPTLPLSFVSPISLPRIWPRLGELLLLVLLVLLVFFVLLVQVLSQNWALLQDLTKLGRVVSPRAIRRTPCPGCQMTTPKVLDGNIAESRKYWTVDPLMNLQS